MASPQVPVQRICGAKQKKGKRLCLRPKGHVGYHNNQGHTWPQKGT